MQDAPIDATVEPDRASGREPSLVSAVAAARAAVRDAAPVHDGGADLPRFELFHAASSICSQKVRVILAHHRLQYIGHQLNLFAGDTYLPAYVRLRMLGCDRFGGPLVSRHDGNTSAGAGGCDGAVVPTLIDWRSGDVIVDSLRICLHLDGQVAAGDRLRPANLAAAVDAEMTIVDALPNYQMLMGRTVGGNESANSSKDVGGAFSQRKVAWCDRYLAENPSDAPLVAAYTAKRAKELSAAEGLFSADAMRVAYDRAEAALIGLNQKLSDPTTPWLYGRNPTLADLFWGIELLRMQNVGIGHYWESGRLPNIEAMLAAITDLAAIRSAIIDWPGATF